ncbi:hypothetical protein MPTK1_8g11660 [Marchantia polymorpha subsp. ruderalis]|uniref:Uncharacterized protein n=1 Tax=Marchantia polymorpha TaxID=3197 RepID=A0A2R6XME1_MARPO|nr:hypothetical protein MARPO_0008s0050 [Marchantia polymorpha]BBN19554.1 hypothetical protein Mp_8g11660 [Marchantia polymorpha subsp. ruderalis]|eukprot:PTQ47270.1 hypothetical protein MARPO_0008s0050 [Marchantia polymorpha]
MTFPPPNTGQWTSGLCDCFEDCNSCCLGMFCPCVLFGRIANIVDQGAISCLGAGTVFCCLTNCTACGFLHTCTYRARMRQKFGLPEKPCVDCCSDYFCLRCSTCQLYRELLNRRIDPSHGYMGVRDVYDQLQPRTRAPTPQQVVGISAPAGQFMTTSGF